MISGQCTFCEGSGKCEECHGTGINPHLNSSEPKCSHCSGIGVCPECEGTGKSPMRRRQYKGNLLLYGILWASGLVAFFALISVFQNPWILKLLFLGGALFGTCSTVEIPREESHHRPRVFDSRSSVHPPIRSSEFHRYYVFFHPPSRVPRLMPSFVPVSF